MRHLGQAVDTVRESEYGGSVAAVGAVWDESADTLCQANDAFGCHGGIENSSIKRDAGRAR